MAVIYDVTFICVYLTTSIAASFNCDNLSTSATQSEKDTEYYMYRLKQDIYPGQTRTAGTDRFQLISHQFRKQYSKTGSGSRFQCRSRVFLGPDMISGYGSRFLDGSRSRIQWIILQDKIWLISCRFPSGSHVENVWSVNRL